MRKRKKTGLFVPFRKKIEILFTGNAEDSYAEGYILHWVRGLVRKIFRELNGEYGLRRVFPICTHAKCAHMCTYVCAHIYETQTLRGAKAFISSIFVICFAVAVIKYMNNQKIYDACPLIFGQNNMYIT